MIATFVHYLPGGGEFGRPNKRTVIVKGAVNGITIILIICWLDATASADDL